VHGRKAAVTVFLFICICVSARSEVEVGASRSAVLKSLGKPLGTIKSGSAEKLYYTGGTVELEKGLVIESDIVAPDLIESQHERDVAAVGRTSEKLLLTLQSQVAEAEARARIAEAQARTSFAATSVARPTIIESYYPEIAYVSSPVTIIPYRSRFDIYNGSSRIGRSDRRRLQSRSVCYAPSRIVHKSIVSRGHRHHR
jgi:hypothetical protein